MPLYKSNIKIPLKVFLGGTCNNSEWRQQLIPLLNINYFNPVVDNWTGECKAREIRERKECDFCLYTITPRMIGVYSIAEVIDDSNKRPLKTIFCLLTEKDGEYKFNDQQINSLKEVGKMVERNGGKYFTSLKEVADYLNKGGII